MTKYTISIDCKDAHEVEVISKLSEIYLLGSRFSKDDLTPYQCNAILDTIDEFTESLLWCLDCFNKRLSPEIYEVNGTINGLSRLSDRLKEVLLT